MENEIDDTCCWNRKYNHSRQMLLDHLESDNPVFLGQGQAPTSVKEGDVNIGLQAAIEDMKKNLHIENEKLEYTRHACN